jgi:hypothetical protein
VFGFFSGPYLLTASSESDSVDQGTVGSVMIATRNIIRQLLALGRSHRAAIHL